MEITLALFANSEYKRPMILKPLDIFNLLKLVPWLKAVDLCLRGRRSVYERIRGPRRHETGRGRPPDVAVQRKPLKKPLEEFSFTVVKYAFQPGHGD